MSYAACQGEIVCVCVHVSLSVCFLLVFDLDFDDKQGSRDEEDSNDGYRPNIDTDRFHPIIREHEKQDISLGELAASSRQQAIVSAADAYPLGANHHDNKPATLTPFAKARPTHQVEADPQKATCDALSELSTIDGDAPSTVVSSEWSPVTHTTSKPVAITDKPGVATAQTSAASHPLWTAWKSSPPDTRDNGGRSRSSVMQQREDRETAAQGEDDLRINATRDGNGLLCGEEQVESAAAGEYETIAKVIC